MDHTSSAPQRDSSQGKRSLTHSVLEERKNYIIGICLLLVVVFLWTSSNFLTQGLFDEGYEKPFLITYLSTSTFALYLLPFAIKKALRKGLSGHAAPVTRGREGYQPLATDREIPDALTQPSPITLEYYEGELPPLTTRETAKLAAWFCLLWFVANWTLTASLGYTSVASATVLSSMSGFFTLGFGRLFRVETLTYIKIGAVLTSFGGVVLVSLSDSSTGQSIGSLATRALLHLSSSIAPILGDTLALLSALFYALYITLLKVQIRSESRIDMQLFFGFVGIFNILGTWPIGVVLHLTGIERFELPHTSTAIAAVVINSAITLSSDYIYVIAMLKTTPLVVTVGLSLTMPLAVIGDFIFKKPVKVQVIIGAIIVLCSFVAIGLEDSHNEEESDLIAGRPLEEEGTSSLRLEDNVSSGTLNHIHAEPPEDVP